LTADAAPAPARQTETRRVNRQDDDRGRVGGGVVVGGGTNVEPNHHHGHRAGGGLPSVWYRGGTVRAAVEVAPHA
jgi:hypothetical protein